MTYPKFSVNYLLKKGISYCKMVAKQLHIDPVGDKRQTFTWADAIVTHQSAVELHTPVEVKKQQVVIQFEDGFDSCDLAGYSVVDLDGNVIRDGFRTYMAAERWAVARFEIVDQQSVAQQELIEQLEAQIEQHADQVVIKEIDFAYSEVVRGNEVLATISHDLETSNWEVQLRGRFESFLTYAEAEAFAINYISELDLERGSGRVAPNNYSIECNNTLDTFGIRHTVRYKGVLAGNIWYDQYRGYTLNGSDYFHSSIDAAKALVTVTRKEMLVEVVA